MTTHHLTKSGITACGLRIDVFHPQDGSSMTFDRRGDVGHTICTLDAAKATCLSCHRQTMPSGSGIGYHFMLNAPFWLHGDETVRPVFRGDCKFMGMEVVRSGGTTRPIDGTVLDGPPLDPRCRMPISINGVQLYRGY